jgi:hypothetical protein
LIDDRKHIIQWWLKAKNLDPSSSLKTHNIFSNIMDNDPIPWEIGKIKSEYFKSFCSRYFWGLGHTVYSKYWKN